MSGSFLVTGTDTGVGKTVVAAGLVAWLRSRGRRVHPLKPVESGTNESGGVLVDTSLLAKCAGLDDPLEANVFSLPEPLAPVLAARRAGIALDVEALDRRFRTLVGQGYDVVVEGAGGVLVELVPGVTAADLAVRWSLPTIVVAGNRLGVLSHTLLTVEALRSRGVRVAGVILNSLHGGAPITSESTNAGELDRTLPDGVDFLGSVSWLDGSACENPERLARAVAAIGERLLAQEGVHR